MENNNGYQQPVVPAPAPAPVQGSPAAIAADNVNNGFVKGIISAIIAWIPIGSIVAIFLGGSAVSLIDSARALAAQHGIVLSGKHVAARILGKVGKIGGIVMTIFWAIYFIILIIIFIAAATNA